jgi:hypothetical protein
MKAKIQNIQKNNNDFQHPQIDVEVMYTDGKFERLFVFTLPHEVYEKLDEATLTEMITVQGKNFKEMLQKVATMDTKETDLKSLIDLEVTI